MAFGENRAGVRRGHRQRHLPTPARTAPQGAAGRDLLRGPALGRGTRGDLPHSLAKRGRDPAKFDLPALVERTPNFSGAEIEEAIISGLYDAFYTETDLATEHVVEALRQTVPLAKTMDEQISRLRAWAEGRARNASVPRDTPGEAPVRRMEL